MRIQYFSEKLPTIVGLFIATCRHKQAKRAEHVQGFLLASAHHPPTSPNYYYSPTFVLNLTMEKSFTFYFR